MLDHTYAAAGTYQVTLTVTDNGGATNSVTRAVTVTAGPPAGPVFGRDTFSRTVTNGLGTAETGGAWTLSSSTTSNYAVNGGTAKITTPAGSGRSAYLTGASSSDTDIRATLSFTRPAGGSAYVGVFARRIGTSDYLTRAVVNSAGTVQAQVLTNGVVSQTATVSGLTFASTDSLQIRAQATGTSPTTLRVKIWRTGAAEPTAWNITRTDSTAGLQAAGSIGLYSYFSSGGTVSPLVTSFDELTAGPTG
jgi:PKD repeat protein